jgi:hypothetical protein
MKWSWFVVEWTELVRGVWEEEKMRGMGMSEL